MLQCDFFGNGETEPSAAAAAAGTVETEKLFKQTGQLFGRDGVTVVQHADDGMFLLAGHGDLNGAVCIAVKNGVAQQIVEHALHFVGVTAQWQCFRRV